MELTDLDRYHLCAAIRKNLKRGKDHLGLVTRVRNMQVEIAVEVELPIPSTDEDELPFTDFFTVLAKVEIAGRYYAATLESPEEYPESNLIALMFDQTSLPLNLLSEKKTRELEESAYQAAKDDEDEARYANHDRYDF